MIPSLSLIVGTYAIVRLLEIISRTLSDTERTLFKAAIVMLSIIAIGIIVISLADIFLAANKASEQLDRTMQLMERLKGFGGQ